MKFLRVNMATQQVSIEEVPTTYAGIGGRGLTSMMINRDVPAACAPLGPDNRLIFAPGIFSGTPLVNTGRISIGAKSPLTGGIKESNAGGSVGTGLGNLGITAIIVQGHPPHNKLFNLIIDKQGIAVLEPADAYKGMRTYALADKLLATHGKKNGILCIGPAGEHRLSAASIQSTDMDGRPCRAAGRGGLGAVMGAKGLKAIVVSQEGHTADAVVDPMAFKRAAKAFARIIKAHPFTGQDLPKIGTAKMVKPVNSAGAFPCHNATKGVFDNWEKISGETMADTINARGGQATHRGCAKCIIHCSNQYVDKSGNYITGALEYETLWSMGGMPGIDDLDTIAKLDFLADDIGLDTMSAGVAIGVAMDAGHHAFGDGQAAIDMMEEIAKGTAFGKILGNGPESVGNHFNHHRIPVVKHQSIAAYDPRAMQGNGVTYATSPMGADHTAGNLVGLYLAGMLDPLSAQGQVAASRKAQIAMAFLDCTGLCLLAGILLASPTAASEMEKMWAAKFGVQPEKDYMSALGIRVLKAELDFNRKAGFTEKDNRLPEFFYTEPLPPHNKVFRVSDAAMDETFKFQ